MVRRDFNHAPFANAICGSVVENYEKMASNQMRDSGMAAWFLEYRFTGR